MKASIFIARFTVGFEALPVLGLGWLLSCRDRENLGIEKVTRQRPTHMNAGYSLTNNQQVWETDTVNAQWATPFEKCLLITPGGPGLGDNFFIFFGKYTTSGICFPCPPTYSRENNGVWEHGSPAHHRRYSIMIHSFIRLFVYLFNLHLRIVFPLIFRQSGRKWGRERERYQFGFLLHMPGSELHLQPRYVPETGSQTRDPSVSGWTL